MSSKLRYLWRGEPVKCANCGLLYDDGAFDGCPKCGYQFSSCVGVELEKCPYCGAVKVVSEEKLEKKETGLSNAGR